MKSSVATLAVVLKCINILKYLPHLRTVRGAVVYFPNDISEHNIDSRPISEGSSRTVLRKRSTDHVSVLSISSLETCFGLRLYDGLVTTVVCKAADPPM